LEESASSEAKDYEWHIIDSDLEELTGPSSGGLRPGSATERERERERERGVYKVPRPWQRSIRECSKKKYIPIVARLTQDPPDTQELHRVSVCPYSGNLKRIQYVRDDSYGMYVRVQMAVKFNRNHVRYSSVPLVGPAARCEFSCLCFGYFPQYNTLDHQIDESHSSTTNLSLEKSTTMSQDMQGN
jgi:hypothetical protein